VKHHFIIKAAEAALGALPQSVPHWVAFINDKSMAVERFHPDFDRIFDHLNLKFWVTFEYKPERGSWTVAERTFELHRTYRIILQHDYTLPPDLVSQLAALPFVERITELTIAETNLPRYGAVSQAQTAQTDAGALIHLAYAKSFTKGNSDVKIAVMDTGINLAHKELQGKVGARADFVNLEGIDTSEFIGDVREYDEIPEDEVGHGTHVSGIIAAKGEEMDEGVCPGCTIMPVRVLATMKNNGRVVGAGIIDNINNGIKWAVDNGAHVINMSLGIRHTGGGLPHDDVIKYALSKNVTIVAASGNDGSPEKYYPGALPGVIAVGAADHSGEVANFTSYGANISVVAPGLNIYSCYARHGYAFASGTSQASPFVTGTVGLMKSFAKEAGATLSNKDIFYILKHTSDKGDSRLRSPRGGYGLINLVDAFKLLNYIVHQ
jgi:subtilisin family serine protease